MTWFFRVHNYSTFSGKPGIHLEDLFVRPDSRRHGHGKALLAALAQLAIDRGLRALGMGGCRLDRNIKGLVTAQPFSSVEIEEFYLEKSPRTHGYIYNGTATK